MSTYMKKQCEKCAGTGWIPDARQIGNIHSIQRKMIGMPQKAMAEALGIKQGYMNDLEHGRKEWSPERTAAFRKALQRWERQKGKRK